MIALTHGGDISLVFVVLALIAFGLAVLAGYRGAIEAAVALALVGVLILLFA